MFRLQFEDCARVLILSIKNALNTAIVKSFVLNFFCDFIFIFYETEISFSKLRGQVLDLSLFCQLETKNVQK
jgi:hypothetical protein